MGLSISEIFPQLRKRFQKKIDLKKIPENTISENSFSQGIYSIYKTNEFNLSFRQ